MKFDKLIQKIMSESSIKSDMYDQERFPELAPRMFNFDKSDHQYCECGGIMDPDIKPGRLTCTECGTDVDDIFEFTPELRGTNFSKNSI